MNTTFTGLFALESFLKIHAYGVRVRSEKEIKMLNI